MYKNTLDILKQTVRKEGVLALYKGEKETMLELINQEWSVAQKRRMAGAEPQASPLIGIAAVNSLLFTAYGASRRLVSPYPDLTVPQVALAGSMAGAVNAVLASPVRSASGQIDEIDEIGRNVQNSDAGSIWRSRR
jgi:solute carrier family 25 carnitine/acylcarnitine transporter 20/29